MSGWSARVADGPILDDVIRGVEPVDRVFVVGEPWKTIRFAPMPESLHRPPHWVIVGGDGIDADLPLALPWPGEAVYRLSAVEPATGDGDDELVELIAIYSYDPTANE